MRKGPARTFIALGIGFWGLVLACSCVWSRQADRPAAVDSAGVMRWKDDAGEVALLGVNYYVPFSLDYHEIKARSLSHEQAIRQDVAHFARLGLGVVRLHCFDREVSDREGNLLDNEHLRLLDFLIGECKRRGLYCVMTPIAWWPTPEQGGFSDLYTMPQMVTAPAARAAQRRYLAQFVSHVNRYTGLAYKDDPAIVAIELINEPQYPPDATDELVSGYINALTDAVRATGCRKPLFYNCWGGREAAAAGSALEGVSFSWYPTGLVSGAMLHANHLPAVDDYPMMREPHLARMARIVYEFDAADVHGSHMYPAMARSFRCGGVQVATQFQYDPLCIAAGNQNWQTHYLNLAYTPNKAISLAIAAEVFRPTPRRARFGSHPGDTRFGDFRVSFERDLSELASTDAFIYSNNTDTRPPAPERLRRVWGCGSSPLVSWGGAGAYFLDRISPGVWKLQIYPDAVIVADPYAGGASEKVRMLWGRRRMEGHLPDLGDRFSFFPCGPDRRPTQPIPAVRNGATVGPGEYLLVREGKRTPAFAPGVEFVAPPAANLPPAAFFESPLDAVEGKPCRLDVSVACEDVRACTLHFRPAQAASFKSIPMRACGAYCWRAALPARLMRAGASSCYLVVEAGGSRVCLPACQLDVERTARRAVPLLQVGPQSVPPVARYSGPEGKRAESAIVDSPDGRLLRLTANGFGPPPSCAQVDWPVSLSQDVSGCAALAVKARGGPDTLAVEVTLVQRDGKAFGANVVLTTAWRETVVPLAALQPMWGTAGERLDPSLTDHVTITFGAWLYGDRRDRPHAIEIQEIGLARQ